MAATTTMDTTTSDKDEAPKRPTTNPTTGVGSAARQAADAVAGAAGEMTARLPEVAQGTRDAVVEATRMVDGRPDRTLELAGVGAVGLALGLLIGGAARILVILALVPVAVIAGTLLERYEGASTVRTS